MSTEEQCKAIIGIHKIMEIINDGNHSLEHQALTLVSNNLYLELPDDVAIKLSDWFDSKKTQAEAVLL